MALNEVKMARIANIAEVTHKLAQITVGRALSHNLKFTNLSNVKSIKFIFNPFDENVESIRDTMFQLSVPKRRETNPKCIMRSDVRSQKCDPEIHINFENGQQAIFRTKALTSLELIIEFNKLCRQIYQKQKM